MKTKNLIIITLTLILSILGCIVATAATNIDITNKAPVPVVDNSTTLTHTLFDGTKIELTYNNNYDTIWETRSEYVDSKNNKFQFDKDGDLVGVSFDDSWLDEMAINGKLYELEISNPLKDSDWLDENTVKNIAKMHTSTMYGDAFEGFELSKIEKNYGYMYDLTFKLMGGKDDCITAAYAYVRMFYDGTLLGSSIHQHKVAASIDENKLSEIDTNLINAVAEANAMAIYREDFRGLEVKEVLLISDGENYALEISTHIDFYDSDLDMIGGTLENFYYSIR
jgi:hypothetical protein